MMCVFDQDPSSSTSPNYFVDHTYRIYPKKDVDDTEFLTDEPPTPESAQLFLRQLHALISDPNNQDIIGWMPHGRSWKIFDKEGLGELLLEYFGCDSLKTFLMSVNNWGFKRLHNIGPDHKSWYHDRFLRGHPQLCQLMKHRVKCCRLLPNLADEPDLYKIEKEHPLPAAHDQGSDASYGSNQEDGSS